jgi:hypothetical protein
VARSIPQGCQLLAEGKHGGVAVVRAARQGGCGSRRANHGSVVAKADGRRRREPRATLGYPVFDAVRKNVASSSPEEVFYCKASGADGRGLYTPEGFVVLNGSIGRRENVPSIIGTAHGRCRDKMLESGMMKASGDKVVFEKDQLFDSPSKAALALMGSTANGWIVWKNQEGKILDELKRQQPATAE